jgi:hypothetical protein
MATFAMHLFDADTGGLIRDCGSAVVPEVGVVPCVVRSGDIAVDIVITSVAGAGTSTVTLDAQEGLPRRAPMPPDASAHAVPGWWHAGAERCADGDVRDLDDRHQPGRLIQCGRRDA